MFTNLLLKDKLNLMVKEKIEKLIKKAVKRAQEKGKLPKFEIKDFSIRSPEKQFGDYSSNIALLIGKKIKKDPLKIGKIIKEEIEEITQKNFFSKIEVIGGFINFFLSEKFLRKKLKEILKKKEKFGEVILGKRKKVQVEFISANPTGPLTLGNGRGAFLGDCLSKALEKAGFKVEREYYINDVGEQIRKLGKSIVGISKDYKGEYIEELKKKIKEKDPYIAGEKAAKIILNEMIKPTVKGIGIRFDRWFSEKTLYESGEVDEVLDFFKKRGYLYKKEGALWFCSKKFGDDKDRVVVRKNGEKTYFASDIAYLRNKIKRGFDFLVYIWGADHAGYVKRIKAAAKALGYDPEKIKIIIMQLVKLFEKGKEIRMSKRKGVYITLEELINEVGLDAARFFFLAISPEKHLNFNLSLAKEKSEKNPVYYIQYAHARISSILRKGKVKSKSLKIEERELKMLNHPAEINLMREVIKLPEVITETARDFKVQRIPQYAKKIATLFHQFYQNCQVLTENNSLKKARLALVLCTKIVLKNTLDLMGISAPDRM